MKRTTGLAVALFCGAMFATGCGEGSETGSMSPPLEGGGAGGNGGSAAVGATWAPIPTAGAGGIAGIGNPQPTGGGSGAGGIAGNPPVSGGAGGMGPTGGGGASGMGPTGGGGAGPSGGTGGSPMVGSKTPTIPEVTGECPNFEGGTISFMGLGGITIDSGPMPSGPTAPMVFYWHGTASFSGEYSGMAADVIAGVRAEGGILVSFQGSTGGDFLSGTSVFGEGDFALTDQMVACAVKNRNVDPRRIYTTGCSAGGLFATAMAAMRSNYIAAAAPNSGGFAGFPIQFQSDHTPPLMTIHGAAGSDVVFIDFSNSSRTADMAFKNRGGFVINCDTGRGHCSGGPVAGSVWEFFKAHPYGVDPYPWTGGLPSGFHDSCALFE